MRNFGKGLGLAMVTVLLLSSCGKKELTPQLAQNLGYGPSVQFGLQNALVNTTQNCFQLINYVDSKGNIDSQKVEIFKESCKNTVLSSGNRVGQFSLENAGGDSAFMIANGKKVGKVTSLSSSGIVSAMCDYGDTADTAITNNCSIATAGIFISGISL